MSVPKPPSHLMDRIDIILDIRAKFETVRNNRRPYEDEAPCTVCRVKGAMVHFQYRGPRAQRMWCDNTSCYIRMMA